MENIDSLIYERYKEISKRLRQIQNFVSETLGVSHSELKAFSVLSCNKCLNQTELSEFCDLDKPAVSRLIAKMGNQKYIEKKPDANDRRNVFILLTNNGKIVADKIKLMITQKLSQLFNPLDKNDKQIHLNLLNKLLNKGEFLC